MSDEKKTLRIKGDQSGVWVKIKWFNLNLGYGFVEQKEEDPDIFLHYSMLPPQINVLSLQKDDLLKCELTSTKDGEKIKSVLEHKPIGSRLHQTSAPTFTAKEVKPARFMQGNDNAILQEEKGKLKWYNPIKGFGFAVLDKGGPDVFIHGSLITSEEMAKKLIPGVFLKLKVTLSERGPEARSVEILD